MLRRLGKRVSLNQNIFATEFILRVAAFRRVAVRLNSVVKFKHGGIVAERGLDLFLGPNIERAFAVLGLSVLEKAVRIFGGKESAFLRGHVARDIIQNIASDFGILSILGDLKCVEIC